MLILIQVYIAIQLSSWFNMKVMWMGEHYHKEMNGIGLYKINDVRISSGALKLTQAGA